MDCDVGLTTDRAEGRGKIGEIVSLVISEVDFFSCGSSAFVFGI